MMHPVAEPYDAAYVAAFYDRFGEREWDRHDASWSTRFAYTVHCHYLQRFIHTGDLVLETGAGPGRFTIELARLGAHIHVSDISPRQLQLNTDRVAAAGYARAVVARTVLDICDLSGVAPDSFDAVICYGGALSYVMDRSEVALVEMLRVIRPGGYVLVSTMSLLGTMRAFLKGVLSAGRTIGTQHNDKIVATGDLPRDVTGHECHLFRWSELSALLRRHGEIVAASATNFLSVLNEQTIEEATDDERARILRWELELCREPGNLDAGTHILAVVQKPAVFKNAPLPTRHVVSSQ